MQRIGPFQSLFYTLIHIPHQLAQASTTDLKLAGHGWTRKSLRSNRHDPQDGAGWLNRGTRHLVRLPTLDRQDRHRARCVSTPCDNGSLNPRCRHGADPRLRHPIYDDCWQQSLFALHVKNRSAHVGYSKEYRHVYQGRIIQGEIVEIQINQSLMGYPS